MRACFTKEYLDKLFGDAPLSVAYAEGDQLLYINKRLTEISGYELEDLNPGDKRSAMLYPDPKIRELILESRQKHYIEAEFGTLGPICRKIPIQMKDGSIKPVNLCALFIPKGRVFFSLLLANESSPTGTSSSRQTNSK